MTSTWAATGAALVADLQDVFGNRLLSVVAYGAGVDGDPGAPLTCLALVASLATPDLEACGKYASKWRRAGLATPLILPHAEFRRSLDTFPLEYGEIMRAHARVFGDDPFKDLTIDPSDLRRACETQAASHLMHLREGFIEAGGRPRSITDLVASSAPAFTAILRNIARLNGVSDRDRVETTRAGARAVGIADPLVAEILAIERPTAVPTGDPARLFPEYLAAVEHLVHVVDTWRA